MSYYTLRESYTAGSFKDVNVRDTYNYYDWNKTDPLSEKSYIRANIAGYYPAKYETYTMPTAKAVEPKMIVPHAQFMPSDFPFTYPCTTIFPKNTDYTKSKSIVTQP